MAEPEVKGSFEKNWKGTKKIVILNAPTPNSELVHRARARELSDFLGADVEVDVGDKSEVWVITKGDGRSITLTVRVGGPDGGWIDVSGE